MLVAVIEHFYGPYGPKAFDLAFKRIYSGRVDLSGIGHLKDIASICQILVGLYLIFLISSVIIEHTHLKRNDRPVGPVLTDHIYIPVSVCNLSHSRNSIERMFDIVKL